MENTKETFPDLDILYCIDMYSACKDSDCVILATEWKEFSYIDFYILKRIVRTPVFVDLRNVYEPSNVKAAGFSYTGVGRR